MSKPVSAQDYFELMQKMANPAGFPFQSLMFPAIDEKEIAKKIAELETVEHWLKANLGLLQLSIKTLQYQRALLTGAGEPKHAGGTAEAQAEKPWEDAMLNPAQWAMKMMNLAGEQMQASAPVKQADQAAHKSRPRRKSAK
jgi:hypothetical protein